MIAIDEALAYPLAETLARRAEDWARSCVAPTAAVRALGRCVRALALAMDAGHVCLLPGMLVDDRPLADLIQDLRASGLVADEAQIADGQRLPFVLDRQGRFYLYRYFDYEVRLASTLAALAGDRPILPETEDDQARAVQAARAGRLTVVSGGPGTGKTTVVARILAELLTEAPQMRVALAAPTGKAAQRMMEALRARGLPTELAARLPAESFTLHRLLGWQPAEGRFRHGRHKPLPYDLVIVDEASMVDLSLATRLVEALAANTRLLLLGDRDQLAAVEKGSVFADLARDDAQAPLRAAVVLLRRNFRFATDSGIGRLATLIHRGATGEVLALLAATTRDLFWNDDGDTHLPAARLDALAEGFVPYLEAVRQARPLPDWQAAGAVHAALAGYRVLTALRVGPRGAEGLNEEIDRRLRQRLAAPPEGWHAGRAVVVLENDYALGLFNGDIGIALPAGDGRLQVVFPLAGGNWRLVAPARLPRHAPAWALTVHKAQGSEFARVAIVLPATDSPVLTRELLYTAVTRTREQVTIIGSATRIAEAVDRRTQRAGGLSDRLSDRRKTAHCPPDDRA